MPSSRLPLYEQLAQRLRDEIAAGRLAECEYLPSERELTTEYDASRTTVRMALQALQKAGYICSEDRRGHRILGRTPEAQSPAVCPVALIMPDLYTGLGRPVAAAIHAALGEAGLDLIAYDTSGPTLAAMISRERDALAAVHTKRIPGLIWWPNTAGPASDVMHQMVSDQVAMVTLDHPIRGLNTEHVAIDHAAAGAAAADHLLEEGHRSIALVAPPFLNAPMLQRQSGVTIAMGKSGAHGDTPDVLRWSADAGERSKLVALIAGPERPYTALICLCDWLAVEVLLALCDYGAEVPNRVAVVGFDAAHEADILRPTLTTVVQPLAAIGSAAAHMALDRLERRFTGPCRSVTLPSELRVRGSSLPIAER